MIIHIFRSSATRRHHCRRCGRLVCSKCSPYKIELLNAVSGKKDRERVCEDCHYGCSVGNGSTLSVPKGKKTFPIFHTHIYT